MFTENKLKITPNLLRAFEESRPQNSISGNGIFLLNSFAIRVNDISFFSLIEIYKNNSDFFYWSIKDNHISYLALQALFNLRENGTARIQNTDKQINTLNIKLHNNWDDFGLNNIPLFFGGMKFSPNENGKVWIDYYDSDWMIPEFLLMREGSDYFLVVNFLHQKTDLVDLSNQVNKILNDISVTKKLQVVDHSNIILESSEYNGWTGKVLEALKNIKSGIIQKVVLSREVVWELSHRPSIGELLNILSERYPKCYVFAFQRGNSVFFGASPEKLAKISGGWIETDALAGSIPRGKSDTDDKKLAGELLASAKNLNEQKAVVDFITTALSTISDKIIFNKQPVIRKLPNIQHLWTPIKAKLKTGLNLFAILQQLHPTPAICGAPWHSALKSITEMETHDRGLYAGIIGWFGLENEAEFAVSIRSALLKNKTIYAYAGCGIVNGSDPDLEYEETELKLKPIKNLFVHEKTYQP